jgi:hypothetical protein
MSELDCDRGRKAKDSGLHFDMIGELLDCHLLS